MAPGDQGYSQVETDGAGVADTFWGNVGNYLIQGLIGLGIIRMGAICHHVDVCILVKDSLQL